MIFRRIIMPIVVVALAALVFSYLLRTRPEPPKRAPESRAIHVETRVLEREDFPVILRTSGRVQARTRGPLVSQVGGRIIEVADSFRGGGFFEEGDILVKIEEFDFLSAITIAKGAIADAEAALEAEEAVGEQAAEDWRRLRPGEQASDLVLRIPQLAQAKSRLASAEAQLANAERDLKRATIRAPYAGRIREKMADIGQFVAPGTILAQIYAVDFAEVELPLKDSQLAFVDVPEGYRGEDSPSVADETLPPVTLKATVAGEQVQWHGKIVRTQGAIDERNHQLHVLAQVKDPYGKRDDGAPPLKVGQFVEAEIEGEVLEGVFILPSSSVRTSERGYIITVIDEGDRLQQKEVRPLWRNRDFFVTRDGIEDGARLCLTAIPYVSGGTQVVPREEGTLIRGEGAAAP